MNNKKNDIYVSVVTPCFNEEDSIESYFNRVVPICERLTNSFEIIIVDDGSKDNTWNKIVSLSKVDSRIKGVKLSRNFGKELALTAALKFSKGQRIFVIDADLQDPPELLEEMMKHLDDGFDVVYGKRKKRTGETHFKLITSHFFYRCINLFSDIYMPTDSGDFRLMTRQVVDQINSMHENNRYMKGIFTWVGFRQKALLYDREERVSGKTGWTYRNLISLALNAFTSFSIVPLRIAVALSIMLAFFSFLGVGYVIWGKITGFPVEGWSSTMVVILFISSLQMLVLGIIGEYVGRLFIESKKRPLYIVSETT